MGKKGNIGYSCAILVAVITRGQWNRLRECARIKTVTASACLSKILQSIRTLGLFLNWEGQERQSCGGPTCASTCWVHDSSPSLYLKRQQHGTRSGQAWVCGQGDAQVRAQGENLRLHQEEGLRCHQKPPPQQGERACQLRQFGFVAVSRLD